MGLPEDGGLVEFAPGTLEGDVGGFTDPVGGAVGLLVGGVVEGVDEPVDAPGLWLCPAELAPPAGAAPPAGTACATAQVPHNRTTESNVSFLEDILKPPDRINS